MSDDFSKGIGGGDSLSFQEKVDEFLAGVSIKWSEFLDFLDEKGIPMRKVNDFFEEKGIPALPVMLLLLLLVTSGAFLAFQLVTTPSTNVYSFKVLDLDGRPVSQAAVSISYVDESGNAANKEEYANENGVVKFSDIPAEKVQVVINAPDFETKTTPATASKDASDTGIITIELEPIAKSDVTVLVVISGPQSANVEIFYANDSNDSNALSVTSGVASQSIALTVPPNAVYKVKTTAEGYREEEKELSVQTANVPMFPIEMFKIGDEKTVPISIRVFFDSNTNAVPVANASITIRNANTDAILAQLTTGELGETEQFKIKAGSQFTITARHEKFLSKTTAQLFASQDQQVYAVKLLARTEENSKNIVVVITDENGDSVQTPFVNLYCNGQLLETQTPRDGAAAFDVSIGTTCTVTASQNGYIASSKTLTSKDEQTLILERATPENSGKLTVTVIDENKNPVPNAQVAIKEQSGAPLGTASIETDIEGKAIFDYLPLTQLLITATTGPRQGTQAITMQKEVNEITITLKAAKAIEDFYLKDHYSGKPVPTAQILLNDSTGTSQTCTTVAATCTLSISDGNANIKIKARGYEELETQITATGGLRENKTIELISTNVASKAKIIFLGIFDSKGKKMQALAPNTKYKAKYLLRAVETNFQTASAFMQIGQKEEDLETLPAVIIDYSAPGAKSKTAGVDYSSADFYSTQEDSTNKQESLVQLDENKNPIQNENKKTTTALENGDLSSTKDSIGTSKSKNVQSYKWAQFNFEKFTGVKEITITIETKITKSEQVELFHRSEYKTKDETIRAPQDDTAGKTKAPLYAKLEKSASYELNFPGDCSQTTCVQLTIDSALGTQTADTQTEVQVPEIFKVNFKILSSQNTPQTVRLETENTDATSLPPVEIIDAFLAGEKIKPTTTSSGASGANTQITAILKQANSGEFTLRAIKAANEFLLKFTTGDYEKQISIRVVNSKNTLKVTTTPQVLEAFKENKVTFKITDAFDQPVDNAQITLEGEAIDSQVQALAVSADGKSPKQTYTAQVNPTNPGTVKYTIAAPGYKKRTGEIQVEFKKIIQVTPKTKITLNADSQDLQTTPITITNLLTKTKVKININAILNQNSKYAILSTSQNIFTLNPGETKDVQVQTRLKEEFQTVANTQNSIKENIEGTIQINARAATTSTQTQKEKIPLSLNVIAQQQPLANLIETSQEQFTFEVNPPKTRSIKEKLKITNKAPIAIVLNHQSDLQNVKVTPTSATIYPEQTIEFTLIATPSLQFQAQQCTVGEVTENGKLELIATTSTNAVQTRKEISLEIKSSTDKRCNTGGTFTILPMDARMQFPPGTQVSKQPSSDGFTTAVLPNGQAIVFSQGAQVNNQEAYVPAEVPFEIPQGLALPIPPLKQNEPPGEEIRVPVNTILSSLVEGSETNLPGNKIRLQNQYVTITFEKYNFNALAPVTFNGRQYRTQFAPTFKEFGYGSRGTYLIPAYAPIQIQPTSLTTGAFNIKFDVPKVMTIPKDAQVIEAQDSIQLLFPQCTRMQLYEPEGNNKITDVLPAAISISIKGANANENKLKIPPDSLLEVKTCTETKDEDERMYSTTSNADVSFIATSKVENPITTNYELSMADCMDLKYLSSYSFGITTAKKIKFPSTITKSKDYQDGEVQVINVERGETIHFLPCNGAALATYDVKTQVKDNRYFSVTSQEGEYEVALQLSEQKKETSVKICLNNYRSETLHPASKAKRALDEKEFETYYTSTSTNLLREAIPPEALSKPTKSEQYAAPLSTTKKQECNNEFALTAKLPQSLLDTRGCVMQEKQEQGQVKFTAKSKKTKEEFTASLNINLQVMQDEKKCAELTKAMPVNELNGVYVNLQNTIENLNEKTRMPPVLDFKGLGQAHSLHFSIINNYVAPLTITLNAPPSVQCTLPSQQLENGDSMLAQCTPISPSAQTGEKIEITASGPANAIFKSEVQVKIQDQSQLSSQAQQLYTSSPWGTVAPGFLEENAPSLKTQQEQQTLTTASAAELYTLNFEDEAKENNADEKQEKITYSKTLQTCQKHFCSYSQAKQAYREFIALLSMHAREITNTKETAIRFCADPNAGGKLAKSTILLLADSPNDYGQIPATPKTSTGFKESIAVNQALKGCGYYKIRAVIDPCSQTDLGSKEPDDIRRETTIQVQQIEKLASCPTTLANAPLHVAGNLEDVNIYVGRRTIGLMPGLNTGLKEIIQNPTNAISLLALGPYASNPSKEDSDSAVAFLKTTFGEEMPDITRTAENYNDDSFCVKEGVKQITAISAAQAGAIAALAATGIGAPAAAKIMQSLVTLGIDCAIGLGAESAVQGYQGTTGKITCNALNFCVRSALTAPIAVPGAKGATTAREVLSATTSSKKALAINLLGGTAVTAVVIGAAESLAGEDEKLGPLPLSTVGPLVRRTGTLNPFQTKETKLIAAMEAQGGQLAEIATSKNARKIAGEILKVEKENPGLGVIGLASTGATSAGETEQITAEIQAKTSELARKNAQITEKTSQLEKPTTNTQARNLPIEIDELKRQVTSLEDDLTLLESRRLAAQSKVATPIPKGVAKATTATSAISELPIEERMKLQQLTADLHFGRAAANSRLAFVMIEKLKDKLAPGALPEEAFEEIYKEVANAKTTQQAEEKLAKALRKYAQGATTQETAENLVNMLKETEAKKYLEFETVSERVGQGEAAVERKVSRPVGLKQGKRVPLILEEIGEQGGKFTSELKTNAEKALKASKGKLTGSIEGLNAPKKTAFKSKLARFGAIAGTQFLFDVDVRPVQFEIPIESKNALVIYNLKDYYIGGIRPSAKALCYISEGQCKEKYYLANLCNSDKDACLYVYKKERFPTTYFIVLNNQQIDKETLFKSIMTPGEPITEFKDEQIEVLELTDLSQFTQDTDASGDGKGIVEFDEDAAAKFKAKREKLHSLKTS